MELKEFVKKYQIAVCQDGKGGYDIYTSCGIGYYDCEPGEFVLKHDRNECTLAEADEILSHLEMNV